MGGKCQAGDPLLKNEVEDLGQLLKEEEESSFNCKIAKLQNCKIATEKCPLMI